MLAVAFAFSLGSYPPALLVLEDSPDIFATVRGGVRQLGVTALMVTQLGHLALFLREGIAKDGVAPRSCFRELVAA